MMETGHSKTGPEQQEDEDAGRFRPQTQANGGAFRGRYFQSALHGVACCGKDEFEHR